MKKLAVSLLSIALLVCAPFVAVEAAPLPIQFAKGKTGTSVSGKVTGGEDVDYAIRAAAGQTMTVDFKASKGAAFFNVVPPGSAGEALFVGFSSGNHYEGVLPADGVYTLRVYLKGGAKDSGKPVSYTLKINISGGARAAKSGGGTQVAEQACLAEVAKTTGVSAGRLSVGEVTEAQSGFQVMVKVPKATAPWFCRTDRKGKVEEVRFTGSEGKL